MKFCKTFVQRTSFFKGVSDKTSFKATQGIIWVALNPPIAGIYSGSDVGKTVLHLSLTKNISVFCLTADSWIFLLDSFHSTWFSQYSGEGELFRALFIKDGKLVRVSDGNTGNDRALEAFLTFCQEKLKEVNHVEVQAFLFDSEHASVHPDSKHHTEVFVPEQHNLFQFIGNVKVERPPDAPRKKRTLQGSAENSPGKRPKGIKLVVGQVSKCGEKHSVERTLFF